MYHHLHIHEWDLNKPHQTGSLFVFRVKETLPLSEAYPRAGLNSYRRRHLVPTGRKWLHLDWRLTPKTSQQMLTHVPSLFRPSTSGCHFACISAEATVAARQRAALSLRCSSVGSWHACRCRAARQRAERQALSSAASKKVGQNQLAIDPHTIIQHGLLPSRTVGRLAYACVRETPTFGCDDASPGKDTPNA